MKHSDADPQGFSCFQIKFFCYTTIFSLMMWVLIAYLDGWGTGESMFADLDEWFLNQTRIGKEYTNEYGDDFPLAMPNTTAALYESQGRMQFLWLDPMVLFATVG